MGGMFLLVLLLLYCAYWCICCARTGWAAVAPIAACASNCCWCATARCASLVCSHDDVCIADAVMPEHGGGDTVLYLACGAEFIRDKA